VQNTASSIRHFIELINATHSSVTQNKCTTIQKAKYHRKGEMSDLTSPVPTASIQDLLSHMPSNPQLKSLFPTYRPLEGRSCAQTNGVENLEKKRQEKLYLEKLRFTGTGISHKQNIDVTPVSGSAASAPFRNVLICASKHLQ
jgi:hypothetical protein